VMDYDIKSRIRLSDFEMLLWCGKPKKKAFIARQCLTMMPFALVWLLFDLVFISFFLGVGEFNPVFVAVIPFMILHLAPVWIWIGNMIMAGPRWKNTYYYITDSRIIICQGTFNVNEISLYYDDIKNVRRSAGLLGAMLGSQDVVFDLKMPVYTDYNSSNNSRKRHFVFHDLEEADKVYDLAQKIVLDRQNI